MDSSDVTAGTNATATQYNNLRHDLVLGKQTQGAETDAATVTFDWSSTTKGKVRTITLGGNRTFAFTNPTQWQTLIIRIIQDGTGSRTITWPSNSKFDFGATPSLSTGANAVDVFGVLCRVAGGTPEYEVFKLGTNMS